MKYEINQFRWDTENGFKFYHLVDSKEFESNKMIPEQEYIKNGSYFTIRNLEDDIQTKQRTRKRKRSG